MVGENVLVVLSHLYNINAIFLPRQVGTNIGKSQKRRPFSLGGEGTKGGETTNGEGTDRHKITLPGKQQALCEVRENGIFAPFIYKNEHFAKTGSGQT
jgi:hypothetical protein